MRKEEEQGKASRSLVIGTAGHIDHGKTTLVKALTGIDTDRLPEEKRRGITIDLGFASLVAPDGSRLSFVDVPGHKLFVRNMLAGATGIDCMMLVVAADEGIKPQTEEHLTICKLLGISKGLVVLTKADLVSDIRLEEVRRHTLALFRTAEFGEEAPAAFPVSATKQTGITELRDALFRMASAWPARELKAPARLPIDRAFVMRGFGTVVTGTMQSGVIEKNQTLLVQPGARQARVRAIQIHGREEERATAGSRAALNLAGIEVGELKRGDTLVPSNSYDAVDTVDVATELLPGAPPLKHRARVRFHAFSSDVLASISLYDLQPVAAGTARIMRLKLSRPIVLLPGDRFVLRQCSPAITIGGGRVLDAHPLHRLPRKRAMEWLSSIADCPMEQQMTLRVARRRVDGLKLSELQQETGAARKVLDAWLQSTDGTLTIAGDLLLSKQAAALAETQLFAELSRAKEQGAPGVKRSELRANAALGDAVFDFLLQGLQAQKKIQVEGDTVRLPGTEPQLPEADRKRMAAIEKVYATSGLAAPLLQEVAGQLRINDAEIRRLMTLLLRNKTLVRMGADNLYMHREPLANFYEQVRGKRGQQLDVAALKQLTGLSRKYVIPLLEHLDREHITRRQGDSRIVL